MSVLGGIPDPDSASFQTFLSGWCSVNQSSTAVTVPSLGTGGQLTGLKRVVGATDLAYTACFIGEGGLGQPDGGLHQFGLMDTTNPTAGFTWSSGWYTFNTQYSEVGGDPISLSSVNAVAEGSALVAMMHGSFKNRYRIFDRAGTTLSSRGTDSGYYVHVPMSAYTGSVSFPDATMDQTPLMIPMGNGKIAVFGRGMYYPDNPGYGAFSGYVPTICDVWTISGGLLVPQNNYGVPPLNTHGLAAVTIQKAMRKDANTILCFGVTQQDYFDGSGVPLPTEYVLFTIDVSDTPTWSTPVVVPDMLDGGHVLKPERLTYLNQRPNGQFELRSPKGVRPINDDLSLAAERLWPTRPDATGTFLSQRAFYQRQQPQGVAIATQLEYEWFTSPLSVVTDTNIASNRVLSTDEREYHLRPITGATSLRPPIYNAGDIFPFGATQYFGLIKTSGTGFQGQFGNTGYTIDIREEQPFGQFKVSNVGSTATGATTSVDLHTAAQVVVVEAPHQGSYRISWGDGHASTVTAVSPVFTDNDTVTAGGSPGRAAVPRVGSHLYTRGGSFVVTVTVTDDLGRIFGPVTAGTVAVDGSANAQDSMKVLWNGQVLTPAEFPRTVNVLTMEQAAFPPDPPASTITLTTAGNSLDGVGYVGFSQTACVISSTVSTSWLTASGVNGFAKVPNASLGFYTFTWTVPYRCSARIGRITVNFQGGTGEFNTPVEQTATTKTATLVARFAYTEALATGEDPLITIMIEVKGVLGADTITVDGGHLTVGFTPLTWTPVAYNVIVARQNRLEVRAVNRPGLVRRIKLVDVVGLARYGEWPKGSAWTVADEDGVADPALQMDYQMAVGVPSFDYALGPTVRQFNPDTGRTDTPKRPPHILAMGIGGRDISLDGTASWTGNGGGPVWYYSVAYDNDRDAIFVNPTNDAGELHKSIDGGRTFTVVPITLPESTVDPATMQGTLTYGNGMLVRTNSSTTSTGLIVSDDGGETWSTALDEMSTVINVANLRWSGIYWYVTLEIASETAFMADLYRSVDLQTWTALPAGTLPAGATGVYADGVSNGQSTAWAYGTTYGFVGFKDGLNGFFGTCLARSIGGAPLTYTEPDFGGQRLWNLWYDHQSDVLVATTSPPEVYAHGWRQWHSDDNGDTWTLHSLDEGTGIVNGAVGTFGDDGRFYLAVHDTIHPAVQGMWVAPAAQADYDRVGPLPPAIDPDIITDMISVPAAGTLFFDVETLHLGLSSARVIFE